MMTDQRARGAKAPTPPTSTRRALAQWLGTTTVLALGADLLAACSAAEQPQAEPFNGSGAPCPAGQGFPFSPAAGDGPAYFHGWNVRTVDPQSLEQLLASWRLTVDGLVEAPLELTFAALLQLPRQDQITDFHCVEGWSVHDVPWNGVHLSQLLEQASPAAQATHLTFHSAGGIYRESLPLEVALEPRTMLAYGVDCQTLPLAHGFPLRLVVPRLLGYKNAKHIERIELTDEAVNGFWVQKGYPYAGEVPGDRLREGKY